MNANLKYMSIILKLMSQFKFLNFHADSKDSGYF